MPCTAHDTPFENIAFELSSGSGAEVHAGAFYTMHADFWNAWDQARLVQLVDYCINGGRHCT